MQSKELVRGIIDVAVGVLKEKKGMAAYIKLIHGVLINKHLNSEDKVHFLTQRLDTLIKEGVLDPRPIEDEFLNKFEDQPTGAEFINQLKET
tara:strand:- start:361 stop:636 length:276 start_codon:yes stop_codon:yes gene_type:complete